MSTKKLSHYTTIGEFYVAPEYAPQYEAIDRRCEGLSLSERAIGEFTE